MSVETPNKWPKAFLQQYKDWEGNPFWKDARFNGMKVEWKHGKIQVQHTPNKATPSTANKATPTQQWIDKWAEDNGLV